MRRAILCILLLGALPLPHLAAQAPETPLRRLRHVSIRPRDVAGGTAISNPGYYLNKPINLLAFTADDRNLASASFGDQVTLWDLRTSLPTPAGDAKAVAHYFGAKAMERYLASTVGATTSGNVSDVTLLRTPNLANRVPDPGMGRRTKAKSKRAAHGPYAFTSPDGATALTAPGMQGYLLGGSEQVLRTGTSWTVCDAKTGQKRFDLIDSSAPERDVVVAEIEILVLTDYDIAPQASSPVQAWSPTGRHFAWTGTSGNVLVTDAYSGATLTHFPATHSVAVTFSADGKSVAHASADGTVRVHEVATGKLRAIYSTDGIPLGSLAFSHDGALLAGGASDASIFLWDAYGRDTGDVSDLAAAWTALSDADPAKARAAARMLRRDPARTIPWLRTQIAAQMAEIQRDLPSLIAALDSPSYTTRRQAELKLRQRGPMCLDALKAAANEPMSLEAVRRVELLMKQVPGPASNGGWVQLYRSLELLEGLGAIEPIETLARGNGLIATEARQCWKRLQQRNATDS